MVGATLGSRDWTKLDTLKKKGNNDMETATVNGAAPPSYADKKMALWLAGNPDRTIREYERLVRSARNSGKDPDVILGLAPPYVHTNFPSVRYSASGEIRTVHSEEEELELGEGWYETPQAPVPRQGDIIQSVRSPQEMELQRAHDRVAQLELERADWSARLNAEETERVRLAQQVELLQAQLAASRARVVEVERDLGRQLNRVNELEAQLSPRKK